VSDYDGRCDLCRGATREDHLKPYKGKYWCLDCIWQYDPQAYALILPMEQGNDEARRQSRPDDVT